LYTIAKFIHNNLNQGEFSLLISRTLGKIVVPDKSCTILKHPMHCNTFWVCKILSEIGKAHKGILLGEPLFPVITTTLLPGFFTVDYKDHWVYLNLKKDTPIKPYIVPKTIKNSFLKSDKDYSIVVIPYNEKQIHELKN
jgi:hypothetical protein